MTAVVLVEVAGALVVVLVVLVAVVRSRRHAEDAGKGRKRRLHEGKLSCMKLGQKNKCITAGRVSGIESLSGASCSNCA